MKITADGCEESDRGLCIQWGLSPALPWDSQAWLWVPPAFQQPNPKPSSPPSSVFTSDRIMSTKELTPPVAPLVPGFKPGLCSRPSFLHSPRGPFLYLKTDHITSGRVILHPALTSTEVLHPCSAAVPLNINTAISSLVQHGDSPPEVSEFQSLGERGQWESLAPRTQPLSHSGHLK